MAVGTLDKEAVTEIPSHDEIVARAERVAIALRDNAAEADDLRRVPDDSVRLMKEHVRAANLSPQLKLSFSLVLFFPLGVEYNPQS